MNVLGDFCEGCSKNRPQNREWQKCGGGFLLKQSAFYGNVENILIFSSSELKIFNFASSKASTKNQKFSSKKIIILPMAYQSRPVFPKGMNGSLLLTAVSFSAAQHILHIKKRQRCVKLLITAA